MSDYQVCILERGTGSIKRIFVPSFLHNLRYSRKILNVSEFAMTIPPENGWEAIFDWDDFVEIYRRSPVTLLMEKEETFLITSRDIIETEDGDRLLIGGQSILSLCGRRVVNPADDPLAAGGYSIKAGEAGSIIREFLREQMGDLASADRQTLNLDVPVTTTSAANVGNSVRFKNLWVTVRNLALSADLDLWMVHEGNGALTFNIGTQGTDKSTTANLFPPYTVLSPLRGNLFEPEFTEDRSEELTYVHVGGDGNAGNQVVLEAFSNSMIDTPYNRKEEFIKAQNNKKELGSNSLITQAKKALVQGEPKTEFKTELVDGLPGSTYQKDLFLGDIVTVYWGELSRDLRIKEVDIALDSDKETVSLGVTIIR